MEDYGKRAYVGVRDGRPLDGGALVAQMLVDLGVTVAFGVHGGHLDAALVGMHDRGIRLVDTRHEAVAVNAADGYARVNGEIGVAFATAGAGLANAVAGLSTALVDRSPVLLITSSPPRRDAETNPLQGGLDQVALVRPVTKWAHQVTTPEEIPRLIAHAVRIATTGAQGPVVLDFPIDVLFGPVNERAVSAGGGACRAAPPAPARRGVVQALEVLSGAERPAMIVGSGLRSEEARALLAEFATLSKIPVFHQSYSVGALRPDHPCYANTTKNLGALTAAGDGPDVVLVLGARFGKQLGGRRGSVVPFDATVIQVDTDPVEIGRMRPVEVGLTADVGETLSALLDQAGAVPFPARDAWLEKATGIHTVEPAFAAEAAELPDGIHPFHAIRETFRALPEGASIVVDGGENAGWAGGLIHEAKSRRAMGFGGYLGYLGIGKGLAIGAQVAEPERPVVLVIGDGSVGFNIQEFDTLARHRLPVLVVVVNNSLWAMSSHGQNELYGATGELISHLPDTAYHEAATALGCHGQRIERLDDLAPAIAKWAANPTPTCLNVMVSGAIVHPSTVAAVGNTDDPNVIVVPYYENVPT